LPARLPIWICRVSPFIRARAVGRVFGAVTVRANWRVIFRFANGDVRDADYLDYH
jgi:hypothetical protein